jgi:O-antigen biosynthesis protein WbqP
MDWKLLRSLRLDEMPNPLNIPKGDMVFVGPHAALYNQDDLMALRVAAADKFKPGIRGWVDRGAESLRTRMIAKRSAG